MVDRIDESTNIIYACWVHKPILTLAKTVTNNNGGTAFMTAWTLQAAGPITISGITGHQQ